MAFNPGTGSNHQWRETRKRIGPGTESLNIRGQGEDEPAKESERREHQGGRKPTEQCLEVEAKGRRCLKEAKIINHQIPMIG